MRFRRWLNRMLIASLALLVVLQIFVILNLSRINTEQFALLQSVQQAEPGSESEQLQLYRIKREAISRAALYDALIERRMLVDGMVIHRGVNGEPEGLCDSLLFSSLRFYALKKLGFTRQANEAWAAIIGSRDGAQWRRHPRCGKSLSRDMVMGVLVALRADPVGGDGVFRDMLAEIDRRWGFVGDGPFYVSWLSPGVAGLLRMEAERRGVPFDEWPWIMKQSFSSIEYDAMFLGEGYVSHLAALGVMLEMSFAEHNQSFNPRSLMGQLQRLISGQDVFDTQLDAQRRQWITGKLRHINGTNIFYEWLDQKSYGVSSPRTDGDLLAKLLSMPQFPADRLPMDCDRDADYLWQRREAEALPVAKTCRRMWSGVDFLWMAAVLGAGSGASGTDDEATEQIRLSH
jgi:hypothetical protein